MTEFVDALGQPHAQFVIRLLLGGLLVVAGAAKLLDRRGFLMAVAEYRVLPKALERPYAALVPWVETALGVLLLLGLGTTVAAALAIPLLLSFGIAIGLNLWRRREFDCHCFGSLREEPIGWPLLLRAALLSGAAAVLAVGASRYGALDRALWGSAGESLPPTGDIIPLVLLAALAIDVLVLLPAAVDVQDAFRRTRRIPHGAHATGNHKQSNGRAAVIEGGKV